MNVSERNVGKKRIENKSVKTEFLELRFENEYLIRKLTYEKSKKIFDYRVSVGRRKGALVSDVTGEIERG